MTLSVATMGPLRAAFSSALAPSVEAALAVLSEGKFPPHEHEIGPVTLGGEVLHIPSRIYNPEPERALVEPLPEEARLVVAAIYSRHHDGHVRERYLGALLRALPWWGHPFVLQLLGEYVLPIIEIIQPRAGVLAQASGWSAFLAENPRFVRRTKSRMVSYWDCYHRRSYPRLRDYPGFLTLDALGAWSPRERQRILAG